MIMTNKCFNKYHLFLVTCYETVPLNQNGIVNGIIYFEKGYQCEELRLHIYANHGVRVIELLPDKYYKMEEQSETKEYSFYVGDSKCYDVVRIKFSLSLSKFDDSVSQFADGYDRDHGCFDIKHDLLVVKVSCKIDGVLKKISEDLSVYRHVAIFDNVQYSLKTAIDYLLKQQYIYAQCEMIQIIQKIKTLKVEKSKKLLADLENCHNLLLDITDVQTIVNHVDKMIANFAEYV